MSTLTRRSLVIAAVAAALLTGACTSSSNGPTVQVTSMPDRPTTTRPPASDPPPPTRAPPGTEATELLEFPMDEVRGSGRDIQVVRAGDISLINAEGRLVAVDADGGELWKVVERFDDIPSLQVQVYGTVAVVSREAFGIDVFPQRLLITGIDVATGDELWKNTTSAFVSFVSGRMVTSECAPKQTGKLGKCTITARDPQTVKQQWQQKSYASARVTNPLDRVEGAAPEELWVTSYPTGADSERTDAFELATGAPLGVGRAGGDLGESRLLVAPGLGVFFVDDSDPTDNGCRPSMTAVAVPGRTPAWNRQFTLATYPSADGKQLRCSRLDAQQWDEGTASIVEQDRPQLIDLTTGRTVWDHAAEGEPLRAVTQDAVLTAAAGSGSRLISRARSDGRERWTLERAVTSVTIGGPGRGSPLLVEADVEHSAWTLVLSPSTGKLQVAGLGELVDHGDGWFATYVDDLEAKRYGKSGGVRVFQLP